MNHDKIPEIDPQVDQAAPAPFDKEAARARYHKLMRGPFMRSMYAVLIISILLSWVLGFAAVFSPGVEGLPLHDASVRPQTCIACHTGAVQGSVPLPPPMPHLAAPSCGFCHRQSLPSR